MSVDPRVCPCSVSILLLALLIPGSATAQICGDCDSSGAVTVLDALRAARMGASLQPWSLPADAACDVDSDGDVDILDALRIAQFAVGTPVSLMCSGLPPLVRAVDVLATTAVVPTRSVPLPGNPEGDVIGLNQGRFNDVVTLGAGGNPVVLFEPGQTFQVVLEATLLFPLRVVDVTAPVNPEGVTSYLSSSPSMTVSAGGLITAIEPNRCSTIDAVFTPTTGAPLSTSFLACLDLHGVDQATRAIWLPEGEVDAGLAGLPSGPPAPPAGGAFTHYYVMNGGAGAGFMGLHLELAWDPNVLRAVSISGTTPPVAISSSEPAIDSPLLSLFDNPAGRFHGIVTTNLGLMAPPIFDLVGVHWEVVGAGPVEVQASLASAGRTDGSPYSRSYPGGAPAASHQPAAIVPGLIGYLGSHTCATTLCGDADGSGSINILDSLALDQYLAGLVGPGILADNANVIGDVAPSATAIIDVIDTLYITLFLTGLTPLSCCP